MKILFISDIHGITDNLHFIENKLENKKFDKLICLGDLYYTGPTYSGSYTVNSKRVHEFLTRHKDILICMKGNCDSAVDIKASDFPMNDGISLINIDDLDIYITHGHEYSFEKNNKLNRKGILVYGHDHVPYIKKDNDMIYVCVGSISLPRNSVATYAVYENRSIVIYDINDNIIASVEL